MPFQVKLRFGKANVCRINFLDLVTNMFLLNISEKVLRKKHATDSKAGLDKLRAQWQTCMQCALKEVFACT